VVLCIENKHIFVDTTAFFGVGGFRIRQQTTFFGVVLYIENKHMFWTQPLFLVSVAFAFDNKMLVCGIIVYRKQTHFFGHNRFFGVVLYIENTNTFLWTQPLFLVLVAFAFDNKQTTTNHPKQTPHVSCLVVSEIMWT
jgi:hypothetical protein